MSPVTVWGCLCATHQLTRLCVTCSSEQQDSSRNLLEGLELASLLPAVPATKLGLTCPSAPAHRGSSLAAFSPWQIQSHSTFQPCLHRQESCRMDWAGKDLKDHLAPTLWARDGGYCPVIIRNHPEANQYLQSYGWGETRSLQQLKAAAHQLISDSSA